VAKPVTTRLVGDVESAIKSLVTLMVEEGGTGSTWIDNYSDWPIDEIIPVRNAVIRLAPDASLMTIPPTPNLFSIYSLQYNYVSDSPKPVEWLKFLRTIWGDDHDAINTLGEWFGYSLLPSSQYQKMLMMIGPPRSGKGTIARVLGSMVGRENIIGPTLQQFNTSFGMSAFICKLVAVIADARLQGSLLSSQGVILERLLAISGGDELTCDRKFKSHVTMRLTTKIVFLSNDIPEFRDSSEAVVTRFIYLKLTESFLNREDKGLFDRLVQELPSILLWAIEGLWRLRERGHFIQPETGRSLFRQMSSTASPIKQFVEERCILDGEIRAGKLFNEWELWCLENKRDVGKPQRFGRDLHAAFPKIEVKQKRYEEMGGTNRDTYYGIQLRPPEQYEPNPESIVAVPY